MARNSKLFCVKTTKLLRRLCTKSKENITKPDKVKSPESTKTDKASNKVKAAEASAADQTKTDEETSESAATSICEPPKSFWKVLPPPQKINVSLLGADCTAGRVAAFLLKQHYLIRKLYISGQSKVDYLAKDLNNIDTSCKVEAFSYGDLPMTIRAAHIAVLIDVDKKDGDMEKKFKTSYGRVVNFAKACSLHCPRAVLVICVEPICCMVPLVQSILDKTPWFHPSKLLGSVGHLQDCINSTAGEFLGLDPKSIQIPLLGGPDAESIVPILSLMSPEPGLCNEDTRAFYDLLKKAVIPKTDCATINEGYAIAKMVITIAKGLCGQKDALTSAFARTNVLPPYKYLVCTVRFGEGGICDNYGIPKLTKFELDQFERSLTLLSTREKHLEKILKKLNKK